MAVNEINLKLEELREFQKKKLIENKTLKLAENNIDIKFYSTIRNYESNYPRGKIINPNETNGSIVTIKAYEGIATVMIPCHDVETYSITGNTLMLYFRKGLIFDKCSLECGNKEQVDHVVNRIRSIPRPTSVSDNDDGCDPDFINSGSEKTDGMDHTCDSNIPIQHD